MGKHALEFGGKNSIKNIRTCTSIQTVALYYVNHCSAKSRVSKGSKHSFERAGVRSSFYNHDVLEQHPRSHHKRATSMKMHQVGFQMYNVNTLCTIMINNVNCVNNFYCSHNLQYCFGLDKTNNKPIIHYYEYCTILIIIDQVRVTSLTGYVTLSPCWRRPILRDAIMKDALSMAVEDDGDREGVLMSW